MNTHATTSFENAQADTAILGGILDSFIRLIAKPKPASTQSAAGTFSALQSAFEASSRRGKSLLVIRVENEGSEVAGALVDRQRHIVQQLEKTCGLNAVAAPIGDGEYAVLLLGIEQCGDLIPRMESVISRMASGHMSGDGVSLKCGVGVARCPLDAEDLGHLIRMASTAASELGNGGPGYQFITRRHRLN